MPAGTTAHRILDRVRRRALGAVWIPADFHDLGSRRAIDTALHRLVRRGALRRLAQGLYDRPTETRFGPRAPDMEKAVEAIARRTGSRVQPAGEGVLNRLGLSTQVPAVATYATDGPSRRLHVLGRPVVLRHVVRRRLIDAGGTVGLVLAAFRALGREGVDESVVTHLRRTLDAGDLFRLRRSAHSVVEWQRQAIARIVAGTKS
jgi:hypothetical protein